jgi:hypothetical protein
MSIEDYQDSILSLEDIGILIEKYSRLNKKNYAEILSKDFDGETWKKEGKKIMSYIKVFEVIKSELEAMILDFEKKGNLDMLNKAKEKLEKANIEIIPIIEEIKKIVYYFEVKFKKIGKFKNTYGEIVIILKNEVEEKKKVEELSHNINRKYLNIQKEIRKIAKEIKYNYYFVNYDTGENLINKKDKENDFTEIKIKDEKVPEEEIKEEDIKEEIKEEEDIKEEKIKEEEYKKVFEEKFSLEQVKNWSIKNWFIFIFFLFFFILGFLVGKI